MEKEQNKKNVVVYNLPESDEEQAKDSKKKKPAEKYLKKKWK